MLTQEQAEQRELIVNAINVLVAELNNKMDEAARAGLNVQLSVPYSIYIRETRNAQHVEARIFQEIR